MEFDEFKSILLHTQWKIFFDFADTEYLADGENVYHTCNLCPYETKHIPNTDFIDDIDNQIAKHLFDNHYTQAVKGLMFYKSQMVGAAKGQAHLDTEPEGTERGQLE